MATLRYLMLLALLGSGFLKAELTLDQIRDLSPAEIEKRLPDEHPSNYLLYSARLFRENNNSEASKWYYIGALRFTIYLKTNPSLAPDADPAVYESLVREVFPTVLSVYRRDFKGWIATIDAALAWDEAHANGITDKIKEKETYDYIRKRLKKERDRLNKNRDRVVPRLDVD